MTVTIHARGLSEAQLKAQAGHETTKLYREHGGAFIYRSESPKAEQTADFTITNLCTDKPHVVVSFTMIRRDLQTGAMEPAALEDTLTLSVLDLEVKTGTRKKRTLTSNNLITVAVGQTLEVGFCFEHVVSSDKSNGRVGIRFDSDDLGAPFYSEFYYVASKVSATKQPRAAPETPPTSSAAEISKRQKLSHLRQLIKTRTKLDATIAKLQTELHDSPISSAAPSTATDDDSQSIASDLFFDENLDLAVAAGLFDGDDGPEDDVATAAAATADAATAAVATMTV